MEGAFSPDPICLRPLLGFSNLRAPSSLPSCNLRPLSSVGKERLAQPPLRDWLGATVPTLILFFCGTGSPRSASASLPLGCCRLVRVLCTMPFRVILSICTFGCKLASVTFPLDGEDLNRHTMARATITHSAVHRVATHTIHTTVKPSGPSSRSPLAEPRGILFRVCL